MAVKRITRELLKGNWENRGNDALVECDNVGMFSASRVGFSALFCCFRCDFESSDTQMLSVLALLCDFSTHLWCTVELKTQIEAKVITDVQIFSMK